MFGSPEWLYDVDSSIPAEVFDVLGNGYYDEADDRDVNTLLDDECDFDFEVWYAENKDEFWTATMDGPKVAVECDIGIRIKLGRVKNPL